MVELVKKELPAPKLNQLIAEQLDYFHLSPCWICSKPIKFLIEKRVLNHCHITDKYRGPAHNVCNYLLHIYKEYFTIPVFSIMVNLMTFIFWFWLWQILKKI